MEAFRLTYLTDVFRLCFGVRVLETFLDNRGRVLLNAQLTQLCDELIKNDLARLCVPNSHNLGDRVVAERVGNEFDDFPRETIHQTLALLEAFRFRDKDLNNAEAVAVHAEFIEMVKDLFEYKVLLASFEALAAEHLLDDMRSILILGQFKDSAS